MITEYRRNQIKQYQHENYIFRKAHGLCTRCGKEETVNGETLCWRCKLNERDRKITLYIKKIDRCLCPTCGQQKTETDKGIVCRSCNAKRCALSKHVIAERKERGECTGCGKKLPNGYAFARCDKCRAKAMAQYYKRKQAA